MKYSIFLFSVIIAFLMTSNLQAQFDYPFFKDSVEVPAGIEPVETITPINLTGNIKVLYVVVGFPDRPHEWPNIPDHPILRRAGTFPNGTLLSDSLDQLNGQISVDEWFGKAPEYFFNLYSNGQYTATVSFPKDTISGSIYAFTTDSTLDSWLQRHIQQYPALLDTNTIYPHYYQEMINQISKNIYLSNLSAFENVEYVNFTFIGISSHQFHKSYFAVAFPSGLNISIPVGPSYNIKGSIAKGFGALTHEMLHCIGSAVNHPTFTGLPDRGTDRTPHVASSHHNNTGIFDIMHHSGEPLPSQYSLYGTTPMISHDLIFLGWIKPDEVLTINLLNTENIKLADMMYTLTPEQKNDNFYRVIKVMTQDPKEYYLIDFHKGSEFDRNLMNLDEGPAAGGSFNNGLIIWHIKEGPYSLNLNPWDHYIDVEVAVPYNGWHGNPIPDDDYPRNYQRPTNFNGQISGDYDYLDDYGTIYLPDGGRHYWSPLIWWGFPWGPWLPRTQSMKSDFFTNEPIKGLIHDRITCATRPSTKDINGNQTYIAITDIHQIDSYMTCNVYYNYWDGNISGNATWSGDIIVGKNLVIPENVTLTIDAGTNIKFDQDGKLTIKGTVEFNGTENDSIRITSLNGKLGYGIRIMPEEIPGNANLNMNYCSIKSLSVGVESTMENVTIRNSTFSNCTKGISLINASGLIADNYIKNCSYGIFVNSSSPEVHDNTIRHCSYNGIYILSGSGTYLKNVITECGYLDVPKPGGFLAIEGSSPILEYEDGGLLALNEIIDNFGFGIHASDNTNIFAGSNEELLTGNSMFNNRIYDAEALYTSTIYAMNNWWGTPDPSTKQFHTDFEGTILYEPWMEEPPEGESLNAGIILEKISEYQSLKSGMAPENTGWKKLLLKYLKNRNHQQLIALGKALLENSLSYRDASLVISFLQHSSLLSNDSLLIPYLKSFSNLTTNIKLKRFVSALLVENYLHFGKIDQAVNIINHILNQYPNSSIEAFALLKKFHVNLHYKNDIPTAEQNYLELKNNYPIHTYTELALNELNAAQCISSPQSTNPKRQKIENIEIVAPRTFALNQNYPNPFNPQTTIIFSLPEKDQVSFHIYNTLGQNVKTLDLGYLDSGDHQIIWNGVDNSGNQVASGIYIYELKTSVYHQTKKMLLMR